MSRRRRERRRRETTPPDAPDPIVPPDAPDLTGNSSPQGPADAAAEAVPPDAPDLLGNSSQKGPVDREIAALAERQDGVVTHSDLVAMGLDPAAIQYRLAVGRLHRVHRGVYSVGHRLLTRHGRWVAAVRATGGVLSHESAAEAWGITAARSGPTHVTVPHKRKQRDHVRLHEMRLRQDECTAVGAIPVTTVARTLLDLAATARPERVRKALNEAEIRRLDDPLGLAALIERYPRRAGTPLLRGLLDELTAGAAVTRSDMEDLFRQIVADFGLPVPVANAIIEGEEVDCAWPARRVVVELDSRTFHMTRAAFEADRARDRKLQLAGWRVIRVTWLQLTRAREALAADLRRLLS